MIKSTLTICLILLVSSFYAKAGSQKESYNNEYDVFIEKGLAGRLQGVLHSPRGDIIAALGSNEIILWDPTLSKQIKVLNDKKSSYSSFQFSIDGKLIIAGGAEGLTVWNVESGRVIRRVAYSDNNRSMINAMSLSSDGRYLVTAQSASDSPNAKNWITLWDTSKFSQVTTFPAATDGRITTLELSPDDQYITTAGYFQPVQIWRKADGKVVRSIKGYDFVNVVSYSPDGDLLAIGNQKGVLAIHSTKTGMVKQKVSGLSHWVMDAHFSPDGRIIVATDGRGVAWDIKEEKVLWRGVRETEKYSTSVSISPDGHSVVTGDSSLLKKREVKTGRAISTTALLSSPVASVAYAPDSLIMATGDYAGNVSLWDGRTGQQIRRITEHKNAIRGLKFSPDSKRMVSMSGDRIITWDFENDKKLMAVEKSVKYGIHENFDISPNGQLIALSGSFSLEDKMFVAVQLLDLTTGRVIRETTVDEGSLNSLLFSADGKYLVGTDYTQSAIFWDVETLQRKTISNLLWGAIVFSSDSRNVFESSGGHVSLKNFQSGDVLWRSLPPNGENYYTSSLSLSANGDTLAIGTSEGFIYLVDAKTGRFKAKLVGGSSSILSLSFSGDGRFLLSGGDDNTARLWDVSSGNEALTLLSFVDGNWLAMTPSHYFSGSDKGAAYIKINYGLKVYSIDQFHDQLYRPDIVAARISAVSNKSMKLLASSEPSIDFRQLAALAAPKITILSPSASTTDIRDIEIKLSLIDQGGGIGELHWKINGVNVSIESPGRALKRNHQKRSLDHVKHLTLSPGDNLIEVIAYNADGTMSSLSETLTLSLEDSISSKPSLHLLAVGINRYRDKSLWLNYAVADAEKLAESLAGAGKDMFENISIVKLIDSDATYKGLEEAFTSLSKKAKTNDVFVLYLAGHGQTLDGRYHFIPVDFRYRNENSIREKAINQGDLQKWMSMVPARKSLILLDTCNSGSFVAAEVSARGMSEKTAIDKLIRATGRTTISASTDTQVALEGVEGHGVFTYALMRALAYADRDFGNEDGVITTAELASYIDEIVPELTYQTWGYEQVPQVNLHGRPFPIGISTK